MTLLDIRNQLLAYFTTTPLFTTSEFSGINLPAEFTDHREALVRSALFELQDDGYVREAGAEMWILSRPLNADGQDVHISMGTSVAVADVINAYLKAHGVEDDHSDASALKEEDIVMLLQIIGELVSVDPDTKSGAGHN